MNISPINFIDFKKNNSILNKKNSLNQSIQHMPYNFATYPSNYFTLSFCGERVDKSLKAFCERNKDIIPKTVADYVDSLTQEQLPYVTPLQAQKEAYSDLEYCENVDDVRELFPNEPLFANLKNSNDSKATHGILYDISLLNDLAQESNEEVLPSGEDFTVYLLKKLFMEAKTIDETNEDLHENINPLLQKDDKNYVSSSTLRALGIKLPSVSYLNSLKYTREGYADDMGKLVSDRWKRLSDEEKIERLSALLNSNKNLSPEKREQLKKMRSRMMKSRWENMSAAEKVAYIEKMQTGSSDNRVVTTYAWNNSKKLREDMSKYFVENNFYNPHSVIYRDTSYTNSMSILMTDFWKNNPKAAVEFGETLSIAHEEFQKAKDDERLEEFIKKTYEDRDKIKNEIKQFVSALKIANAKNAESFSDNFKKVFSDLPSDIVDFIADAVSKYPKDVQDIYFKACKGGKTQKERRRNC